MLPRVSQSGAVECDACGLFLAILLAHNHNKQAVITGMTRDGLFLVEDGQIVAPVRNLRFTQSYLDALAGVEAVSMERRALEGFLGTAIVPAMRIASLSFTGTTADV